MVNGNGMMNSFGESSIGLDGMAMVFNGSHLMVGKQASIGVNQVTMVFGETTTGLDGFQW